MKSRKNTKDKVETASVKIDKKIHKKIDHYKELGIIPDGISSFVNKACFEKLDKINRDQVQDVLSDKLDEIRLAMGKMSMKISELEKTKTHSPSRKNKRKK